MPSVSPPTLAAAGLGLGLVERDTFAKDADLVAVRQRFPGRRSADDVVGEHRLDIHLSPAWPVRRNRSHRSGPAPRPATVIKTIVASYLCFDMTRASSSETAVPDASSLAPGASHFASVARIAHRIVVAGHDINTVRVGRASKRRNDVGDLNRLRNAGRLWLRKGLFLDLEAAAAIVADTLKLAVDPIACRTDTAFRVRLRRQRVPRAKRNELAYRRLDVLRRHLLCHRSDGGVRLDMLAVDRRRQKKNRRGQPREKANEFAAHITLLTRNQPDGINFDSIHRDS